VFYNLAITGLSVAICFFIGGVEVLSLIPQDFHVDASSGFWAFMANFNINKAGFIIVGMFIVTWVASVAIWRWGHIEERWTARLHAPSPDKWGGDWAEAEASE
jgi:high-affinity nickel-transport protein